MTTTRETNQEASELQSDTWQLGQFETITAPDGIQLAYCCFINPNAIANIVISAGRCESYLKYQTLIKELFLLGCSVFVLDHRGQGLSQRLLRNSHKGYVRHFDDYAKDLGLFVSQVVKPRCKKATKIVLLAHSMGSAIGIRLMQLKPTLFDAAILSSPMIAINTGKIPFRFALILARTVRFFNSLLMHKPWYFFGQKNYQEKPFENNPLMADQKRYKTFVQLYRDQPKLQLGGVTVHWLVEALLNTQRIMLNLNKLKTPITLLQAEKDTIVDNHAQNLFCQHLYQLRPDIIAKQPIVMKNAKHEILFETDDIRDKALSHIKSLITKTVR